MIMEKVLKILHAADFHLDSPYDALNADKAVQRRSEARSLLHRLTELAHIGKADIVLLSGDLLDGDRSYGETAELLKTELAALEIPVFIAPGNHDFYAPGCVYERLELPENVHVFTENRIDCVEIPALGARVWGAAFTDRNSPALLSDFSPEKKEGFRDVLVIHGDVGQPNSPYNPISEKELASSNMDYVALGHVHSFSGLCKAGDTCFAWPGCAEGRGFDECGEKGIILADISQDGVNARFIPLGGRRYEKLEISLTGEKDVLEAVEAAIPGDCEGDIYRLILTGERAVPPDVVTLETALAERFFALQIKDKTIPRRELWERCGEDTLRGLFLTKLRREYDAAQDDEERGKIALAARYGLAALDNMDDIPM